MRLDQFRFPPAGRTTTLQKLGSQPIETPRLRLRVKGYPLTRGRSIGLGGNPLSQIRLKGPPTIHQRFMYEIFHGLINPRCHQASEAYLSLA